MAPRFVKVLTPVGKWEYMRVIERSPLHWLVKDAAGKTYLTSKPKRVRGHRP